jgi:hypothetical protein
MWRFATASVLTNNTWSQNLTCIRGKMMIEQVYPIVIDGKFVGIAGVDRALTDPHEFLRELKPP